jgi:spore cortex formation protein SpoVR/YcgB (stage V sporulation)
MTSISRFNSIAVHNRDEMASQLSLLLFHREHGLLSQAEYEETLEYFESFWAPDCRLDEQVNDQGATHFVFRDKRTGIVLDSFYFRRYR